jgi:putative addiction module component (TIGR02574 family)
MSQSPVPITTDFLFEQALKLPVPERLELMDRIGQSLPPAELLPLTEERRAELRRRVQHLQAHPEDRLTWDHAESDVRNSR